MTGKITRVSGNTVKVAVDEWGGAEVAARALVHRIDTSPETFTTYRAGDRVALVDDDEGGLLILGVLH